MSFAQYDFTTPLPDDQKGLGLETGHGDHFAFGPFDQNQFQDFHGYGEPSQQQMPYRPALALDTSGPSFQHVRQPSSLSSSLPTGHAIETPSLPDAERVITPAGMQYPYMGTNGQPSFPFPGPGPSHLHQSSTSQDLDQEQTAWMNQLFNMTNQSSPFQQNFTVPMPPQNTVAPHQFAPDFHNPPKLFGDLMRESRGSTSSASSTEGPHEWNGNGLESWRTVGDALNRYNGSNLAVPPRNVAPTATVPAPCLDPTMSDTSADTIPQLSTWQDPTASAQTTGPFPLDTIQRNVSTYMLASNRFALGERKIVISSPKVGQKSYGSEKRFLCPHPQAALYGAAWWAKTPDGCPKQTILPPRINISLSEEAPSKDSAVTWHTLDGQKLDEHITTQAIVPEIVPFIGNVAGKNLHISENDGKKKDVRAVVTVKAPLKHYAGPNGWGPTKGTLQDISSDEVIGTFESKEIKVISKPSKKKASSKSGDCEWDCSGSMIPVMTFLQC